MTRNPAILLALARQGYSDRTIAEIAAVTPAAIRALLGSCQRSGLLVAGAARGPVPSMQRKS
jgi:DNA-binding CsgD family transcriptional regulator